MVNIADLDKVILLWINQSAGQNGVVDKLAYDIADAQLLKGGLFVAVYWWLWFDRKGERRREVVVAMVAATITAVLSRVLQVGLPFHQRPLHTPGIGIHLPLAVDPETLNTFSSFPSDHAMLFFALSVPLWNRSRWLGSAAMLWTALVICLPRVYLGYHYPSDVLAGAVLGILLMVVLSALISRMSFPYRAVHFANIHPAAFYPLAFILSFELATLFADVRHLILDALGVGKMLIA
jgi:undecaprenyl-diphosphatase